MLETLPDHSGRGRQIPEQRQFLARALGMLIEAERTRGA
jgi:hypothetical protein